MGYLRMTRDPDYRRGLREGFTATVHRWPYALAFGAEFMIHH
jgi:hypothetical protein